MSGGLFDEIGSRGNLLTLLVNVSLIQLKTDPKIRFLKSLGMVIINNITNIS